MFLDTTGLYDRRQFGKVPDRRGHRPPLQLVYACIIDGVKFENLVDQAISELPAEVSKETRRMWSY